MESDSPHTCKWMNWRIFAKQKRNKKLLIVDEISVIIFCLFVHQITNLPPCSHHIINPRGWIGLYGYSLFNHNYQSALDSNRICRIWVHQVLAMACDWGRPSCSGRSLLSFNYIFVFLTRLLVMRVWFSVARLSVCLVVWSIGWLCLYISVWCSFSPESYKREALRQDRQKL